MNSYLASQDFCLERTKKIIDLIKSHSRAILVLGALGSPLLLKPYWHIAGLILEYAVEGEQALSLLAQKIGEGRDVHDIPGLVFRDGAGFRRNPMRLFGLKDASLAASQGRG